MLKNSRLEKLFKLSHKITVYVPATADVNKIIDNTKFVELTAKKLSEYFGGATSTPAIGFWVSDIAGLVREKTTLVFAYATENDLQAHIDDVLELCEHLKTELNQEAVALEIDGDMYFV